MVVEHRRAPRQEAPGNPEAERAPRVTRGRFAHEQHGSAAGDVHPRELPPREEQETAHPDGLVPTVLDAAMAPDIIARRERTPEIQRASRERFDREFRGKGRHPDEIATEAGRELARLEREGTVDYDTRLSLESVIAAAEGYKAERENAPAAAYQEAIYFLGHTIDAILDAKDEQQKTELSNRAHLFSMDVRHFAPKVAELQVDTELRKYAGLGDYQRELKERIDKVNNEEAELDDHALLQLQLDRAKLAIVEARIEQYREELVREKPLRKSAAKAAAPYRFTEKRSRKKELVLDGEIAKLEGQEYALRQREKELNEKKHGMSWLSPLDWPSNMREWRRIHDEILQKTKEREQLRYQILFARVQAEAARKRAKVEQAV